MWFSSEPVKITLYRPTTFFRFYCVCWVLLRFSSFIPQYKNMHTSLIGGSADPSDPELMGQRGAESLRDQTTVKEKEKKKRSIIRSKSSNFPQWTQNV